MTMVTASKLNEFNQAEAPARLLLERLGWTYVPREALAAERGDEREVLKGRLRAGPMNKSIFNPSPSGRSVWQNSQCIGASSHRSLARVMLYSPTTALVQSIRPWWTPSC